MASPDPVTIRKAAGGDLDRIAELWHESAGRMDGAAEMPSREALRRRIDDELRSGWDLHVALIGDRLVRMLALKPAQSTLDQLFVLPSAQDRGIGRALLDAAKRLMPSGFSLRVATANHRARRFYERQGLTLLGEGAHPHGGAPVCFYGWTESRR